MQKFLIGLLFLTGCATPPPAPNVPAARTDGHAVSIPPAPQVLPVNPLEPKEGESRAEFLGRQIQQLDSEIVKLEPLVIAAGNRVDPKGPDEATRLKEQLFSLERQKASLELQLLSLP